MENLEKNQGFGNSENARKPVSNEEWIGRPDGNDTPWHILEMGVPVIGYRYMFVERRLRVYRDTPYYCFFDQDGKNFVSERKLLREGNGLDFSGCSTKDERRRRFIEKYLNKPLWVTELVTIYGQENEADNVGERLNVA